MKSVVNDDRRQSDGRIGDVSLRYGVEILSETFDKDFDEVGFMPKPVEDDEEYDDTFGY